MKQILTFFIVLFGVQLVYAQPVMKTMKRLPDTGETTSYTITFGEEMIIRLMHLTLLYCLQVLS